MLPAAFERMHHITPCQGAIYVPPHPRAVVRRTALAQPLLLLLGIKQDARSLPTNDPILQPETEFPMIASAEMFASTERMEFNAAVETPYSDDGLVPGADPYIAQLVANHEAEVTARRQARQLQRSWSHARMSPVEMELVLA